MLLLWINVLPYKSRKYLGLWYTTLSFLLLVLKWFAWILIVVSLLVLSRLKIWRMLSVLILECLWMHLRFTLRSLFIIWIINYFHFPWLRFIWRIFIFICISIYKYSTFIVDLLIIIILVFLILFILYLIS